MRARRGFTRESMYDLVVLSININNQKTEVVNL